MVDSRHVASAEKSERRNIRPLVYGSVILLAVVAAVITMTMKDGASGAVETALLALAIAATAFGVWGTAMAVKETDELSARPED
ncbi:MAG TPA: hypothetical protein VMU64_11740 [Acidimicrobiales bacterium]|nr:hypothetical protein [Acidimicrobiales bacterium]